MQTESAGGGVAGFGVGRTPETRDANGVGLRRGGLWDSCTPCENKNKNNSTCSNNSNTNNKHANNNNKHAQHNR